MENDIIWAKPIAWTEYLTAATNDFDWYIKENILINLNNFLSTLWNLKFYDNTIWSFEEKIINLLQKKGLTQENKKTSYQNNLRELIKNYKESGKNKDIIDELLLIIELNYGNTDYDTDII